VKIAMIAPVLTATPPRATGPQEQIISLLTEALVARGHDVTLYATGDSRTSARLEYVRAQGFDTLLADQPSHGDILYNHALMQHTFWAMTEAARRGVDVVHSHRPLALLCQRALDRPHVNTMHHGSSQGNLAARTMHDSYFRFFDQFPGVELVAISQSQREAYASQPRIRVIHHAVDYRQFAVGAAAGRDYLLSIGRLIPAKGVHTAIEVALAADRRLKIAGALDELRADLAYFKHWIEPHLDGDRIQYVGEATAESRVELYAGAAALLNPIQWDEPFGLTMLEAMACGTPVIALRRGAAPEIVDEGVTGHLCDDIAAMIERARAPGPFDPAAVRKHAEARFSVDLMTNRYEDAYRAAGT